jgi:hypothetical protein
MSSLEQGNSEQILQMSYSSAQIGLLQSKDVCGFAEAATALSRFSVAKMSKLDGHGVLHTPR